MDDQIDNHITAADNSFKANHKRNSSDDRTEETIAAKKTKKYRIIDDIDDDSVSTPIPISTEEETQNHDEPNETSVSAKTANHCDSESENDEELRRIEIEEICAKLKPTLEVFILKGCLANVIHKSSVIKELWQYCGHFYGSVEMMVRELSPFHLVSDNLLINSLLINCSKLKCLRLSYCEMSVDLFQRLKSSLICLSCLHLHYIYGIESSQEWTQIGHIFTDKLQNFSFASDCRRHDLSEMVSALGNCQQLAFEDYKNDMKALFSSIYVNLNRISLIDYHNIDQLAVETLAKRVPSLKELIMTYESFHSGRANANCLLGLVCENLKHLKRLRFKVIAVTDIRPIFKLNELRVLDLQSSSIRFIEFPEVYHSESLRHLSLVKVLLSPSRVMSMTKCFPYLITLSLTGNADRHHIDSAVFCCECRDRDKTHDMCSLCYQNCFIGLVEFTLLEKLELNYINIKSLMCVPLPYIPALRQLVINPFECLCARALLAAVVKLALMRRFTLIIRKAFIEEAVKEEANLPTNLQILEYQKEDFMDANSFY